MQNVNQFQANCKPGVMEVYTWGSVSGWEKTRIIILIVMVKTNELRIGNYILCNNTLAMVQGVMEDSVLIDGNVIVANDATVRPITLCDTVLQKVRQRMPMPSGLRYSYYKNRPTFLIFENEDGGYYIGMNYEKDVVRITPNPIIYFHQLQNIYFVQYGVEMDINVKVLFDSIETALENGEI